MSFTPSILNLIIAIIFIVCLSFPGFVSSQQFDEAESNSEDALGKPCTQSFHCWRTEPMQGDGIPLSLINRISKRLDLAGISRTKGAKCRCKDSVCQFFIPTQQRFLPCEEF